MKNTEQIYAFVLSIQAVVDRFRNEFDLPVASAIGGLEMVKLGLFKDEMEAKENDEKNK